MERNEIELAEILAIVLKSDNTSLFGNFLRGKSENLISHRLHFFCPNVETVVYIINKLKESFKVKILNECEDYRILIEKKFPVTISFKYDINVLCLPNDSDNTMKGKILFEKRNICAIIKNYHNKQFMVLDYYGAPTLKHTTICKLCQIRKDATINDKPGELFLCSEDISYRIGGTYINTINRAFPFYHSNHLLSCQCISRFERNGMLLMDKISRMISNGWKCLNQTCQNPMCILAPQHLANKLVRIILQYEKNYHNPKESIYIMSDEDSSNNTDSEYFDTNIFFS